MKFIQNLNKAVVEIKRILKNEGIFITIYPMKSNILDFFVSLYSAKEPAEEFINSRESITNELEKKLTL